MLFRAVLIFNITMILQFLMEVEEIVYGQHSWRIALELNQKKTLMRSVLLTEALCFLISLKLLQRKSMIAVSRLRHI